MGYDLSDLSGQTSFVLFEVYQGGNNDPIGMCVDDVTISNGHQSIFLLHGIGQRGGPSGNLAELSSVLSTILDPTRFIVDDGYDYSECSQNASCLAGCSIPNEANKLANYIASTAPANDIILIGYSMGGLLARHVTQEYFNKCFCHL